MITHRLPYGFGSSASSAFTSYQRLTSFSLNIERGLPRAPRVRLHRHAKGLPTTRRYHRRGVRAVESQALRDSSAWIQRVVHLRGSTLPRRRTTSLRPTTRLPPVLGYRHDDTTLDVVDGAVRTCPDRRARRKHFLARLEWSRERSAAAQPTLVPTQHPPRSSPPAQQVRGLPRFGSSATAAASMPSLVSAPGLPASAGTPRCTPAACRRRRACNSGLPAASRTAVPPARGLLGDAGADDAQRPVSPSFAVRRDLRPLGAGHRAVVVRQRDDARGCSGAGQPGEGVRSSRGCSATTHDASSRP